MYLTLGSVERVRHLWRIVGRTVVHDEHFKIFVGLGKYRIHAFRKQMRQSVAKNYKTDSWGMHRKIYPIFRGVDHTTFNRLAAGTISR
jgi:hypothetical protein